MRKINVVCAISINDRGILITRRKKHKEFGGFWEFPGGKVEVKETMKAALKRELFEELNTDSTINKLISISNYTESNTTIILNAYYVDLSSEPIVSTDHDLIKRVSLDELSNYSFCPADIPIIERLKELYV